VRYARGRGQRSVGFMSCAELCQKVTVIAFQSNVGNREQVKGKKKQNQRAQVNRNKTRDQIKEGELEGASSMGR
jgi:hypothetical protein